MNKSLLFLMVLIFTALFQIDLTLPFHGFETDAVSAATAGQSPATDPTPVPVKPLPVPPAADIPSTPAENPVIWSSIPSNWATQDIQKAKSYGLTTSSILDQYNRPITREQFVLLVMKQFYANGGVPKGSAVSNPFTDITDTTITEAFHSGLISGSGNGKFNPNGLLTRQEASVILYREWNILHSEEYGPVMNSSTFSDSGKIAVWAVDAIRFMNQIGVLMGASDGKINPTDYTTREQAIILVLRNFEALNEQSDAVSSATINSDDDEDDDD